MDVWELCILFALYHPIFLYYFVRPFYRMYRTVPRGKRLYFHITDYWCAMAGLAPSFVAISLTVSEFKTHSFADLALYCTGAYTLATSQLAGIFIGRVHNQVPVAGRTLWTEIGWNVAGALFGLVIACLSALMFVLLPILAPPAFIFLMLDRVTRRR